MKDFLTTQDIAIDLNISKKTAIRLIKTGKIPALNKSRQSQFAYIIPIQEYLAWKSNRFKEKSENKVLFDWNLIYKEVGTWILWCRKGALTGKPQTENTLKTNIRYLNYYFNHMPRRNKDSSIISVDYLRTVVSDIDPKSFSIKDNVYKAVRSFTKYLIAKNYENKKLLEDLKETKPKRVYPPKKLHCTYNQFNELLDRAGKKHHCQNDYDVLLTKTTVATLGYTGLRISELCNLRVQDVDLINRKIFVYLGKGKKNRYIGISNSLYEYLFEYLERRPRSDQEYFFLTINRNTNEPVPLERGTVGRKIKRLSQRANIQISPHGLRRTFATVAANSGKPINIISLALGHSDLKTTQGYLCTSQEEVINAMKNW